MVGYRNNLYWKQHIYDPKPVEKNASNQPVPNGFLIFYRG